jgi:hypothetical protein
MFGFYREGRERRRIMRRLIFLGAVLFLLPAMASAVNWYENFDSYVADTQIVGQGGWEEWGAGAGAFVRNTFSMSPSNSVEIVTASDLVHQYSGYTSGKWIYTANVYIPSTFSGQSYFILLNSYVTPSNVWSVQMSFNSSTGEIYADCGSSTPVEGIAYVTDAWSQIKCFIDLDEDWVQVYYEGQLLDDPGLADHPVLGGGYTWTKGPFGSSSGALNIAAVDLFANSATEVYYDDLSIEPYLNPVPETLPVGGGVVDLYLDSSFQNANRNFIILAGVTGTTPGTALPGGFATLPLNWDVFTDVVLGFTPSVLFSNFLGKTDAAGMATATINAPPLPGIAVGVTMYFAATENNPFDFVSNACTVDIVP